MCLVCRPYASWNADKATVEVKTEAMAGQPHVTYLSIACYVYLVPEHLPAKDKNI